ncbi:peptidoglycan-binding domain-containing protein [Roseibium sp. Sym1]|uniref:peptidoglycan-binding domain-containing protein n=1 Tax=Roseibium sp. Sym1 TaxID=3016006 RepID=UPI0022B36742|nr:peptidoglycan-binding domain-containing protein [Roseibium sp. Sym1]
MTSENFSLDDHPRLQSAALNAPPMRWGERGLAVAMVQKAYEAAGFAMPGSIRTDGSADGIFGKETYSVTRHFQVEQKLSVDGIAGRETLTALVNAVGGTAPVSPKPNGPDNPVKPTPHTPSGPPVFPKGPKPGPKPSPKPSKHPHFAEERIASGFDNTVVPPWQMVPTAFHPMSSGGGGAIVKLFHGEGLTVTSDNNLIKVHEIPKSFQDGSRHFRLTSDVDGARAIISARSSTHTLARMEAEASKPYVLTVDFYMVSDTVRKTKRPISGLRQLVKDTSQLLAQQCNIHLEKQHVYTEKVNADLGEVILVQDMQKRVETQDVYLIYQGCKHTADLSVFCVWEYEMNAENAKKGDVHVGLHSGNGRIIMEDDEATSKVGKWTLMHEAGHALNLFHQDGTIMADIGQTMTSYLRKTQIHDMWKKAREIAKGG